MDKSLQFIDLFAGIGGFRLGMERAGHKCVGWVESDPKCEKCKKITKHYKSEKRNFTICSVCGKEKRQHARFSYEAIHNTEGEWTEYDITEVTDEQWGKFRGKVDVICGGFPCQSFSVAGKRGGFADTRGTMFFEIARAAKQIKPRFLFLENVKGLLSHEKGETFAAILSTLDELGYDAEWQLLNSKDFGVPQNRERVFIIGHIRGSGGREVFPIRGENEKTCIEAANLNFYGFDISNRVYSPEGISPTLHTMQGGGREPKIIVKGCAIRTRSYANQPAQIEVRKDDNANTITSIPKDSMILKKEKKHGAVNDKPKLTGGIGEKNFGKQYRQGNRVYDSEAVAMCLNGEPVGNTGGNSYLYKVGTRIRKLTPRECWRLQSFPDWAFDKAAEVNSDSQLYKQAGNGVTVNVIYEISKRLG